MPDPVIKRVIGRSVWDSRGRPTVEAEIWLKDGSMGRAIAPAGASKGAGEALDLRDGGARFGGHGVDTAVANVNGAIASALIGRDVTDQKGADAVLIGLDGRADRSHLGANAMIATSMAVAHAAAASAGQPLWEHLHAGGDVVLPVPEIQILGGGAHADGQLDLQDFMVVPYGAGSFREAMEWTAEIYRAAGSQLAAQGKIQGVADEGGYWPVFDSNEEAIETLLRSIENAGLSPLTQVGVSLDIAASNFFNENGYMLKREGRRYSPAEWYDKLSEWMRAFPILMIEDPFEEHDLDSHAAFTAAFSDRAQIVGDDLLVTQIGNIEAAAGKQACTALLCKPNQVGTLTEAWAAHEAAKVLGWGTIVSARSGETEDVTIAHLALGWGISQIKVGSFTRSERMAKWNELLRLEDHLGAGARYAGRTPFLGAGR
ncbi:phosphopyruvate hydratase [Hyphomonas sp.]|uniref:phosphopyruvate hydratase n=1 Tax=Hyphomonas sp. TaxID=87 RepID=UPI0035677E99